MWFKKNPTSAVTEMPERVRSENQYKLQRVWNIKAGKYDYRLSQAVKSYWSDGHESYWHPYTIDLYGQYTDIYWKETANGNKTWATKTAKHFGLKIEDEADV